ncbi:MAG: ChbG/HpnK family deacetylase [Candidatus Omnitrophota bacterium]
MKQLIVSADDFGLTKSMSEGAVKAYRDGIVTSLNLLPAGSAFEESLYLLKDIKLNEIGAHLSLTETSPVTDPARITSLVTKEGNFHANYPPFFINLFTGKIKTDDIYLELRSQLDRLKRTNLPIVSLNSHEHIHMMPFLLKIFIELAGEYNIPFIRYPHGDRLVSPFSLKKLFKAIVLSYFGKRIEGMVRESGIYAADNFLGHLDSGNLNEGVLIRLLDNLREGTTELVCHPGFLSPQILDRYTFHLDCESELSALTSRRVKRVIEDRGIRLVTYGEILSERKR